MKLEQNFVIQAPIDEVWRAFQNVETLVPAMPGAELISAESNDRLKLRFSVKLGPIAAQFEGTGAVTHDDATKSGVFSGQAADRKSNSRVKGEAAFSLASEVADARSTLVKVDVDYALTGTMAQFSRGAIVKELAQQLTDDFAANLQRMVQSSVSATDAGTIETSEATPSGSTAHPPTPTAATPINGFSLIARALLRWLKGLFGASARS